MLLFSIIVLLFPVILCSAINWEQNLALNRPFIDISDEKIFDSVVYGQRTANFVVLFNARGNYGCVACETVVDQLKMIAVQSLNAKADVPLYFSFLEFQSSQPLFAKVFFLFKL